MEEDEVIVVGAGAAGLAAAACLRQAGVSITLLEARERLGGRIDTRISPCGKFPIELGAEFIHGAKNETWKLVRRQWSRTYEVPDCHWKPGRRRLLEYRGFWTDLESVMERMDEDGLDQDFKSFLKKTRGLKADAKWMAREYIEGFHAAHPDRIGVKALSKANASSEESGGTRQFKLRSGYVSLLRKLVDSLSQTETAFHYRTAVRVVTWEPGRVDLEAETPWGKRRFRAARVLLTLPLGVLQKRGTGAIRFEPPLREKERVWRQLEMGSVVKVTLQFRHAFWRRRLGFVHSDDGRFPTWWADPRAPLLTGWAGGPRAKNLTGKAPGTILDEALRSLAAVFKVERKRVEALLVNSYYHDWVNDPFSRGAYSYTKVGGIAAPRRLAAPIAGTLFFAGEATDDDGEQGTVHGALSSGRRAAEEILRARSRRPVLRSKASLSA